jgi:NADH-quinone oxidoreductase subunit N
MDFTHLHELAASNSWALLWPELGLACLALLLLILETVLPKAAQARIPAVSIIGQLVLLAVLVATFDCSTTTEAFNGLIVLSPTGELFRVFFLLASVLVSILARVSLPKQGVPRVEFHHITLIVSAAAMLLVQSRNFVMLFVALETMTIGLYILVSYFRSSARTLEAGLKYLVMGALSSALLLFGIVLLYGVAGNPALPGFVPDAMRFDSLGGFLAANPRNFLAAAGIVLVLSGIAFKIGGFPFQIWIPDVYQGAPTPVTALLAVTSKAAGFVVLITLVKVFAPYRWLVEPVLAVMAGATILFGNLAALKQHNVKRLMGLSGVSHAGFLLLAVASLGVAPEAEGAVYFYLYAYLVASFAVFGVMTVLAGADDSRQELGDYAGLGRESPFLAGILTCGLGSLAGIPLFAGFMGKFFVFVSAFRAHHYGLLAIAIFGVAVSVYYYFGWIRAAYFTDEAAGSPGTAAGSLASSGALIRVTLALLAAVSVVLGLYQGPFGHLVAGH